MKKEPRRTNSLKGIFETLEERLAMSADPLSGILGGAIEPHSFDSTPPLLDTHIEASDPPPIDLHLEMPDFWRDSSFDDADDAFREIEQTLSSAHGTTGLNNVRADYGFTGRGQTVAVIDSGIAYDHINLGGGFGEDYRVVGGWDFTEENDANPYDDANTSGTSASHGTHVAGIIGSDHATHQGVSPGVDLVALRVFNDAGAGYYHWVESALTWIHNNRNAFDNPITAVNLSLGVSSWNSDTIPNWANLEEEFAQLESDGIFVAVSAGNSFTSYNTPGLSYPAASPYVVPVMSADDSGGLSYYSQRLDRAIAAPGRSITSTVPDYKGNNDGTTDDFGGKSGTSMAAPYVAGASVIVREAMEFVGQTGVTQDTIYNHLKATADSVFDSVTGLAYDRLNLEAAIDALMPVDDYGSTVGSAYNLGTISDAASMSMNGVISTLDDADFFTFVAGQTGTVTFNANNMTHDLEASWSVNGGTWQSSGAHGEACVIDVVAGQTYSVGLSSSDGLGYFDLDIEAEAAFSFTDWGAFTQGSRAGVTVAGEGWYRIEASGAGYMTVDTSFNAAAGNVTLEIYAADTTTLLAAGSTRVDVFASAGQEFYVHAVGTNADVDFRMTNLVNLSGGVVTVNGTAGDDAFTFTAGSTHQVSVNGVAYSFSTASASTFNFDGGAGSDAITLTGTAGDETATLRVGDATLAGSGFTAIAISIENIAMHGGGGVDLARMYDSVGDDVLSLTANLASLYGAAFENTATDFDTVYAYASSGVDVANFHDSTDDDIYKSHPNIAWMYGDGYYNFAAHFDSMYADSNNGGVDRAYVYDSDANDIFKAHPTVAWIYGEEYFSHMTRFESVYAYSQSGGHDRAYFYDSAGDDTYKAHPNLAWMYGSGFMNYGSGFDVNVAHSGAGGNDRAFLYDSSGDDDLLANANGNTFFGTGFINSASGFNRTTVYARTGIDEAVFSDVIGADAFDGSGSLASLTRGEKVSLANGFAQVDLYVDEGESFTADADAVDYVFNQFGGE